MRKIMLWLLAAAILSFLSSSAYTDDQPGVVYGAVTANFPWPASPQAQQIIRDYGKDRFGQGPYNDAAYARQYAD